MERILAGARVELAPQEPHGACCVYPAYIWSRQGGLRACRVCPAYVGSWQGGLRVCVQGPCCPGPASLVHCCARPRFQRHVPFSSVLFPFQLRPLSAPSSFSSVLFPFQLRPLHPFAPPLHEFTPARFTGAWHRGRARAQLCSGTCCKAWRGHDATLGAPVGPQTANQQPPRQ
eukprot:201468-Chlamydomonas_euryale.AAC.1